MVNKTLYYIQIFQTMYSLIFFRKIKMTQEYFYFFIILIFLCVFFFFFTLQYCIGFAIHQHASAMGVTYSHPEPPFHLPPHTIPLGHPSAPAPSFLYPEY